MKTNLETLSGSLPLYQQFDRQTSAQDAYVEIHPDGKVFYESNPEIGNAVPVGVWHRRIRRIRIPNDLTAKGYNDLHESIASDIETIIAGMDEKWDGNNMVGTLTEEAREALENLEFQSINSEWDSFDSDEQALAEI